MFTSDRLNDEITKWTLSTPWDLTTALAAQVLNTLNTFNIEEPTDCWLSPSGETMFMSMLNNYDPGNPSKRTVAQATLASGYDLNTASLVTTGVPNVHYPDSITVAGGKMWLINEVHSILYEVQLP